MPSKALGKSTFLCEVTSIGKNGIWLIYGDKEYYVPFSTYPVFKSATVTDVYAVRNLGGGQLRWDSLDCDIEIDALINPSSFPLVYK